MRGQYILMFDKMNDRTQKVRKPRAFKSPNKILPLASTLALPLDFGYTALDILSLPY